MRATTVFVVVISVAGGLESRGDSPSHCYTFRNFVVHYPPGTMADTDASFEWERQRNDLQLKWFGIVGRDWKPRCHVYLHASRVAYAKAVGPSAENTSGSSLIEVRGTRIVTRRIDLCCEVSRLGLGAFPHELTHVVLADWSPTTALPAWADEGMAILADTTEKRRLHRRDLASAVAAGKGIDTRDLMGMACCPLDESRATFYGQSVSLTEYFVEIGGEHRFVQFLKKAQQVGYDRALVEQYGISSMRELHNDWVRCRSLPHETGLASAVSAGHRPAVSHSGRAARP